MNDRSLIPMRCVNCLDYIGGLDVPIKHRLIGEWLEVEDIKPLCRICYRIFRAAAVQDPD